MTDQPAPILSPDETAARNAERRAERAVPAIVVGGLGRIASRPMTPSEAAAAFLTAAVLGPR